MSGVLEADRTRLESVEAEIELLERGLVQLRIERASIRERLDTYKYPVLTLPNEIVSEIFLHFLPSYPECPSPAGLSSPTLLTHICQKWRQIALTTPYLWRAILFPSDFVPSAQRMAQRINSWLERSCVCPVSISFDSNPFDLEEGHLQTLIPHRLRWEYLELGIFDHLLPIIEGPTPLLRKLGLRVFGSPSSLFSLKDAPLLRIVALNDIAAASIILPWAQLTSLILHNVFPQECTAILLQTSDLVHCQLNLIADDPDLIQPDVKLPCLESLILEDNSDYRGVEATEYLGSFIVPALQKLVVCEVYIGTDPVTALASFVTKSECKLQDVHIRGHERSRSDDQYCKALPFVPKISFRFSTDTPIDEHEGERNENSEGD
ncbi:hypothetical protein C8R43DRAFT_1244879 [Mycena crocata]|nr:hypothetical protein C8R43DRAFT_1244879 [Mycena crocata]